MSTWGWPWKTQQILLHPRVRCWKKWTFTPCDKNVFCLSRHVHSKQHYGIQLFFQNLDVLRIKRNFKRHDLCNYRQDRADQQVGSWKCMIPTWAHFLSRIYESWYIQYNERLLVVVTCICGNQLISSLRLHACFRGLWLNAVGQTSFSFTFLVFLLLFRLGSVDLDIRSVSGCLCNFLLLQKE